MSARLEHPAGPGRHMRLRPRSHTSSSTSQSAGRSLSLIAVALVLLVGVPSGAHAQDAEICSMCHGDASLFEGYEDPGSYVVTADRLARTVHGEMGFTCVDCHTDLAGFEDFPHAEELQPVDCSMCHPDVAAKESMSIHGRAKASADPLAPSCADCHTAHDIRRSSDRLSRTATMNIPVLCGSCHKEGAPVARSRDIPQDQILENYSLSIHGAGLYQQGLTVTAVCTSCHTAHEIKPHTDPTSSIYRDNVAQTCAKCHSNIEVVHRKVIRGVLWESEPNKIPACVDCHAPHKIRKVFYEAGTANADCLKCHSDPELTMEKDGGTISLFVDEGKYSQSDHAGTACAQCHNDVTPSRVRACETVSGPVDCSICHADPVSQYQQSTHGQLAAEGNTDAPTCQDCHEKHHEMNQRVPISPTFPRNVPELCAKCHQKGQKAAVRIHSDMPNPVESYEMSIHGKGLFESGLVVTATCTNCHTAHSELPPDDPASSVNPANQASTCGTCHHGIEEQFRQSIHWPGIAGDIGDKRLPVCEDCHTSHSISRTDRSDFRLMMMSQCGNCHEEEAETFFDTYHGKVSRLGDAAAAKCYDCHGTHNILPPVSPASTLSRRNIVDTCSQCHAGATRKFTGYLTHATHHDPRKYPFLFWSFWAMTALLIGTLTFAMIHTALWLFRLVRTRDQWQPHRKAARAALAGRQKLYRRFTTFQRSLHGFMMLSFLLLALTGMTLKFSYMGWAQIVAKVLGGFTSMGVLHRMGAITLITVFLIHLWDVRKQKRTAGVTWKQYIFGPGSLMFNMTDLREIWGSIKWFFGKGERPRYGRFTYWEKFDYFAVFWGMFIIGSTGLLLWFPEVFTNIIPGQAVNVATIIHSDEALLAVAFIFTIHFFNTHFRLDKFPMDPVIFTGRVPVEELKHDKPREYEQMVAEGKFEEKLVEPYPRNVELGFRVLGFSALGFGLTLIFLILFSMLFGYR